MDKPLSIQDFQGVREGSLMPVYYAGTNVGRFIMKYVGLVERGGMRYVRCEIHNEDTGWMPADEYLYEYKGEVCVNSSADRVYSGWPEVETLWDAVYSEERTYA